MKKSVFIFGIFSLLCLCTAWSQTGAGPSGPTFIPAHLNCVTFRYACTNEVADQHFGAIVNSRCLSAFGLSQNQQFVLSPPHIYCRNSKCTNGESICYRYKNWRQCFVEGQFSSKIYQMLSNFVYINDQLLGNGAGVGSTGGNSACVGPQFAGPLNNLNSRTR
jgi:hypothetical protein